MPYPILAPSFTWYKGTILRSTITEINIVNSYTPTGSEIETWNADADNTGAIKCYITGTVLTIAGNGSGKIYANTNSQSVFSYTQTNTFSELTVINGINLLDTSRVTRMDIMFSLAAKLASLDISEWDVSNVTNMEGMFQGCVSLENLDLSSWNMGKVTLARKMFMSNSSLGEMKLKSIGNVSNWNVGNVTNMEGMFQRCVALEELDVSKWNVESCSNFSYMFSYCHNLKELDVCNWDTGAGTNMNYMFNKCYALNQLDLSGWIISNVTSTKSMFANCSSLKTIYVYSDWNTATITDSTNMFNNCTSLIGGNNTIFNSEYVDSTYARIDGGAENPGYFTDKGLTELLIKAGTLRKIGTGIRKINGDTSKYYPSEMIDTLDSVDTEITSQADLIAQIASALDGKAGGSYDVEDSIITRTLTNYTNNRVSKIGAYAFANARRLLSVDFPAAITIGTHAFDGCDHLTTINFPNVTTIYHSAFYSCSKLTTVSFPSVTEIYQNAFQDCIGLTTVDFSNITTIFQETFKGCSNLAAASFSKAASIAMGVFSRCYNLSSLTLGRSTVCALQDSNAFTSTPYAGYSAYFSGTPSIYVPASLLDSYKTAANWSYFSQYMIGDESLDSEDNTEANIITFTLRNDGLTYQAEDGMTWAEWFVSEYNTTSYTINNRIYKVNGISVTDINSSDVIEANSEYAII